MIWKAKVYVTLRAGVLDPEGETINSSLQALGYDGVSEVRVGKYFEITLDEDTRDQAAARLEEMCDELLANPVIEEYQVDLADGSTETGPASGRK